jgi:hypothetical protein
MVYLILVYVFYLGSAFAEMGPKIHIPEQAYHFGKMLQGDIISHTFSFRNVGDEILTIYISEGSISCCGERVSQKLLMPGEGGQIEIKFYSDMDLDEFYGEQNQRIIIFSNDPDSPREEISATVHIKRLWSYEPVYLRFFLAKDGLSTENREITFKICNLHDIPIKVINCRTEFKELVFNKRFPISNANIQPGETFSFNIKTDITEKISNSKYGDVDLSVVFNDGRKLEKKVGIAILKKDD